MPDPNVSAALQALERAMCLEVDGERFYRQAATRTADRRGGKLSKVTADDGYPA